ncbi:helix-turn-helix domain-containing protein [Paenibacillus solisilvae]|uniref:Helix-turn-helix domain-containing protein n=1 Tax=Paenibacillus solisilvae TaxID=2486751 RepID=A0ABW0VPX0_9BACL
MNTKLTIFCAAVRDKDWYMYMHQHACYELVYYLNGEGTTTVNGRVYSFQPGSFTIIPPATMHDERHTRQSDVIFIGFHAPPAYSPACGLFEDLKPFPIREKLLQMKQEFTEKQPLYAEKLDLLTGELIIDFLRFYQPKATHNPITEKLNYVRNYMNEHFRQKTEVEQLAAIAGYSYDRFRHLFKEVHGQSPQTYLLGKRIEHARSLLVQTALSISHIAQESGFSTDAQFCSLFKRETGCSPRQFRLAFTSGIP